MNIPKLRFKEFTDSYKKMKYKDILKIKSGKNQKRIECNNGKYPILGTGGKIGTTNMFLYNKPSVLIGRKGTINKPQYMETPFWTVDTLFYSQIYKPNIPKYLFYSFQNVNWQKYDESTGVPSLSSSTIESVECFIPSIDEQIKVSNFLSLLDKKIQLQTKKIEALKLFKLALQNNIYGSINDKIKLEDIGCFISGYGFPEKYQGCKNYSIPFYKVSDMNNFGNEIYMNNSNNTLSPEICSLLKLKPISNRSVIFAKIGAAIMLDRKRIAMPPFLIDNNMMSYYINKDDIDFDYIFYFLDSIKFSHYVQQGALPSLSSGDLGKIKIPILNIQKQKIIGITFNLYTRKLMLETEKLNKLNELKKGLMQNMFV